MFFRCGKCYLLQSLVALFLIVALCVAVVGCAAPGDSPAAETLSGQEESVTTSRGAPLAVSDPQAGSMGDLVVHFLDVGQGDAVLLQLPDSRTILVDAGPNGAGRDVVSYLRKQGIKKIDYLIGTHPHADHIGGLDDVIRSFEIGKVYLPRKSHTTKTFEEVLLALRDKGLKVNEAKAGITLLDEDGLAVSFVAPCGTGYESLNNYSAVLRVVHGDVAILLTGDAEKESEQEMLASGAELKADLLKVGHHGSHTSTSAHFLRAVNPKFAVISVGENDYGHPHQVTLKKLNKAGVQVYRTDRSGTVIFRSDGKTLSTAVDPAA